MTTNVDMIKIGKILPKVKYRQYKYGAPASGRVIYCEQYSKNGIVFKYNLYFTRGRSYLIPNGWENPGGLYSRCYKCMTLKPMYNYYEKMLNNPIFKLDCKSLDEVQQIIVVNKI